MDCKRVPDFIFNERTIIWFGIRKDIKRDELEIVIAEIAENGNFKNTLKLLRCADDQIFDLMVKSRIEFGGMVEDWEESDDDYDENDENDECDPLIEEFIKNL